jgi:hypothetical protein
MKSAPPHDFASSSDLEVVTGTDPSVLARWGQAQVRLAIWQRQMPPALVHWLDRCPASALPHARFATTPATIWRDLNASLEGHELLLVDVADLASRFAVITGATALQIRLEAVRGESCHLFHVDAVRARLLTTYRGAGTEYLQSRSVDRRALGCGCNDSICPDRTKVATLPRFAVGLFEGSCGPGGGMVHRSPAASHVARLLLAVDAAD